MNAMAVSFPGVVTGATAAELCMSDADAVMTLT
jgi:hypothetical protein